MRTVELGTPETLAPLPVKEVLAVQAVAMGVVRENARRTQRKNWIHQFTLFENTGSPIGSNDVDRFVSIRTGKTDFRSWRLTVSFLEYILSTELRYSNTREMFQLEWGSEGSSSGTKLTIVNYNPIVETYTHPDTQALIDKTQPSGSSWRQPLVAEDLLDIKERLLDTAVQLEVNRIHEEAA